jgi:Domain of unknown function (DUF4404)
MSHQDLRELLAQLHARLGSARSLDAGSRKLLATVSHDIERALARDDVEADAVPPGPRLEALAVRFEADHPALADVLRQIVDALGKAGI